MSTLQTTETGLKDAGDTYLIDRLSEVSAETPLMLLAVIVLCILAVSIVIIWVSCQLCVGDGRCVCRRPQRPSHPATSVVYQWDSLTTQRECL